MYEQVTDVRDVEENLELNICGDGYVQLYLAITCIGLSAFLVLFIFLYCSERSVTHSLSKARCADTERDSEDDSSLNSLEIS